MIYTALFLLLSTAYGASESKNAFDKSFPRDNTFCTVNGKTLELMIRSGTERAEPAERGFGELLFYRNPKRKPLLLPLRDFTSETFRLFLGSSPGCSKSHGYLLGSSFAILLRKENRPFPDKLAIQLFDVQTLAPVKLVSTDYLADKALPHPEGFAFRQVSEAGAAVGKVLIEGESYIHQQKGFPRWFVYTTSGVRPLPDLSFEKFPWKKLFRDKDEFLALAGWNSKELRFEKDIFHLAVSHKLRRHCFLLTEKVRPLGTTDAWKCQPM
jgi:hypothetical protein